MENDKLNHNETYFMTYIPQKSRKISVKLEGVFDSLETVIKGGQQIEYAVFKNVTILHDTYIQAMCRLALVKKRKSGNISAPDCKEYNDKTNEFYLHVRQWNFISKDKLLAQLQARSKIEESVGRDALSKIMEYHRKGGKTRIKRRNKTVKKTKRRLKRRKDG